MQNNNSKTMVAVLVCLLLLAGLFLVSRSSNKESVSVKPQLTEKVVENSQSAPSTPTSQQSTSSEMSGGVVKVKVAPNGYEPISITIKAGDRVIWTNNSGDFVTVSSDPHPIHTNYPPLNLGRFDDGASVELVFDKVGTYTYHNHLNPSQEGTVTVTQ